MTSARPLFFLLLILLLLSASAKSANAADEKPQPQTSGSSLQNPAIDPAWFGQLPEDQLAPTDLFFLKTRPRLSFTPPAGRARSAVLGDADCYTMRMYKVKRKEHFAEGESGRRGYSTCELASNYQVRTAIAHVQTAEGDGSETIEPRKYVPINSAKALYRGNKIKTMSFRVAVATRNLLVPGDQQVPPR